MGNEQEKLQATADRLDLGPHEHCIEATDEEGRTGRWVVHRPTVREEVAIGVKFAQLRTPPGTTANPTPGPVDLADGAQMLAFVVATLSVVITLRPEWFPENIEDCRDTELVFELFGLYEQWRASFRRGVSADGGGDSGTP